MTIGVDQLTALLLENHSFNRDESWEYQARWLLSRLEAGPPPDRGIVGALTDLQEMGRRIATPAVPRPHEPRPLLNEPSEAAIEAAWEQWAAFEPAIYDPKPRTCAVIARILRAAYAAERRAPPETAP